MTKFYSSTFISLVLAFLMIMGYNNQPVIIAEDMAPADFTYTKEGVSGKPVIPGGKQTEKIRIEIFDDLTCKDCTEFVKKTLPKIKNLKQESDKIDLRLYFIPNINEELYYQAALSLKCAADQQKFWEMHEKLHDNKSVLQKKIFTQLAKELEINADDLLNCIQTEGYKKEIESDIAYASEAGITFKPSLFINQFYLIGHQPFENIQRVINQIINK